MRGDDTASPLVSVIVPFFRAGAAAQRTLRQLAALEYERLEFLLVDDASDDDTLRHLETFAPAGRRVRIVSLQENLGPGPARNAGLAQARGTYVWFVDWDDDWDPRILDAMVAAAQNHDADIAFARAQWVGGPARLDVDTDGLDRFSVLSAPEAFDLLLVGKIKGYLWNKLFRREVLGPSPFPALRSQEDLIVVARAIRRSRRVVALPQVLYSHVVRVGSLTNSRPVLGNLTAARDVIFRIANELPSTPRRHERLLHYELLHLFARATTAIRFLPPAEARREIAAVRPRIRLRDVATVARTDPKLAVRALALKSAGPAFPLLRSTVLAVLGGVRPAREAR
jgi:hypothetical protein